MLISKINLISNTESTLQCKRLAKKQFVFFFLLLLSITLTTAQTDDDPLGTEVVTIVKPYAPSISDAFKIKETPVLNNSVAAQKTPV